MAEQPDQGGAAEQSFAEFVREAPSAAEVINQRSVTVTGVVLRSENEGEFILATPGGQTVTLSTDAVKRYTVLQEAGAQRVVQLEIAADSLAQAGQAAQTTRGLGANDLSQSFTAFYLDTPQTPILPDLIATSPWLDRPNTLPILDTIATLPILDQGGTFPIADQGGTGVVDTLIEGIETGPAEGIDPGFPGGGFPQPIRGLANQGVAPFVMATPHHAPQAAAMAQNLGGAAQANLGKAPAIDAQLNHFKHPALDPIKHPVLDVKHPALDPIKHPGLDQIGTFGFENIGDPRLTRDWLINQQLLRGSLF